MEVFFVRHGETDGNVARRHQHEETTLNEVGRAQAALVAEKVAALSPTHIISSTQLRAIETTRVIAEACECIPETNALFTELSRPSWLTGHRFVGLTTLTYVTAWFFKHSIKGAESYEDFRKRIIEARTLLETYPENARVVVVSHSVFINIFIEHLCLDTRMSFLQAARTFLRIFTLRNTAIVHLNYAKGKGICHWTVVSSGHSSREGA